MNRRYDRAITQTSRAERPGEIMKANFRIPDCSACRDDFNRAPDDPEEYQEVAADRLVSIKDGWVTIVEGHESSLGLSIKDFRQIAAAVRRGVKWSKLRPEPERITQDNRG